MCGLVGIAGDVDIPKEKMFKDMLTVDVLRGSHSTGVASADKQRGYTWAKSVSPPSDALQLKSFKDVFLSNNILLMGHNRHATTGSVTSGNAHPFEHDDVIGMHNGTLINWRLLKDSKDFEVDSDCLFYNIAKRGVEETFATLTGAWAVTWYDGRDHTLNMMRNNERPLHYIMGEGGKTMYWGSEPWMIRGCASRNNIKLPRNTMELKPGKLLTWELPEGRSDLSNCKVKEIKTEVPTPTYYPNNSHIGAGIGTRGRTRHEIALDGYTSDYPSQYNWRESTKKVPAPEVAPAKAVVFPGKGREKISAVEKRFKCAVGETIPFYTVRYVNASYEKGVALSKLIGLTSNQFADNVVCTMPTNKAAAMCNRKGVLEGRVDSYLHPSYRNLASNNYQGHMILDHETVVFKPESEVIVFPLDHSKRDLTPNEFARLTKHGCGLCSSSLFQHQKLAWFGDDPVCEDCFIQMEAPQQQGRKT